MGTTESIFADPEEGIHSPSPPDRQQHGNSNVRHSSSSGRTIERQHRRRPQNAAMSSPQQLIQPPPPTLNHPKQTVQQQQQQPLNSSCVPIRKVESVVFQLNGIVLGLSKSGKRTLLQRLEGKEPDFYNNTNNIATTRPDNESDRRAHV